MYTTLIQVDQLKALQADGPPLMVFDCSFELAQPQAGAAAFSQEHIPGAVHADLDQHLSVHAPAGENTATASGGRHPLPTRENFASWLNTIGFQNGVQAVVYDRNGNTHCGRLWWMLKWLGHDAVAVLDGGLAAWKNAGLTTSSHGTDPGAAVHHTPTRGAAFQLQTSLVQLRSADEVWAQLKQTPSPQTILDARSGPRFRGEVEPLDPVAGHIPGALNRPFTENFQSDGRFKPAEQLRAEFEALLQGRPADSVVHQCGSGVSALPNLLAMRLAGLGTQTLFAGSWSEWCRDPNKPTAKGP